MQCRRCGMENKRTEMICLSCGAQLLRPAKVPGAVYMSGRYVSRRHAEINPALQIRAKRGYPVVTGGLPTPPVQTASAAAPLSLKRRTPSAAQDTRAAAQPAHSSQPPQRSAARNAPEAMRTAHAAQVVHAAQGRLHAQHPPQQAAQAAPRRRPAAPVSPALRGAPVRTPAPAPAPQAAARARVRPAPRPARKPPLRRDAPPSHTAFTGSVVVAGLVLGMAGTWWASIHGVKFVPAGLPQPATVATVPAPENTPIPQLALNQNSPDLHVAKELPAEAQQQLDSAAQPDAPGSPEAPDAHETSDAPVAQSTPAAAAEADAPVSEKAGTRPAKRAAKGPVRETRKRSAPVARGERDEEIGRLRTQAFSETTKDRVGRINRPKEPDKIPISSARAARLYTSTRRAFSECDRTGNILRREQCRWKVCGGMWGRRGCPSYQKQASIN